MQENNIVSKITEAAAEVQQLQDVHNEILSIVLAVPELNMSNYDEDDVSSLNEAMISIHQVLTKSRGRFSHSAEKNIDILDRIDRILQGADDRQLDSTEVRAFEDAAAEIRRFRQLSRHPDVWHDCTYGKIRKYSSLLCSSHQSIDEGRNFDPIQEILDLRQENKALQEREESLENSLNDLYDKLSVACGCAARESDQTGVTMSIATMNLIKEALEKRRPSPKPAPQNVLIKEGSQTIVPPSPSSSPSSGSMTKGG